MTLKERIDKLENSIKGGKITIQSQNTVTGGNRIPPGLSTNIAKNVDNSIKANNTQTKTKTVSTPSMTANAAGAPFWGKVIDTLKEQRQPMLYSNLMNTKGVILDDMTFGIEFPNGLSSFGKSIIEKPENMTELKRLVSIECKKDMRIKLINNNEEQKGPVQNANNFDLGININMIE